jgi:hypothetical protein
VLVLTQSLREACIAEEDVKPLGMVFLDGPAGKGRCQSFHKLLEWLERDFPDYDLIVNTSICFEQSGHSSYNEFCCTLQGDVYSAISQELKEKCK